MFTLAKEQQKKNERKLKKQRERMRKSELLSTLKATYGDMPEDRVEALEVLIKVFEDNGNKPLANELKKIKDAPDQVQSCHLYFETISTYISLGRFLQRPATQRIGSSSPSCRSHNSRKRGKGYRESNCEEVY